MYSVTTQSGSEYRVDAREGAVPARTSGTISETSKTNSVSLSAEFDSAVDSRLSPRGSNLMN